MQASGWLVPVASTLVLLSTGSGVARSQSDDAVAREREYATGARLSTIKANSRLHYELVRKHYDHALAVMPRAPDIDMVEETTGATALCLAAQDESADAIDVAKPLVVKFAADPNLADRNGLTPLHYASQAGNYAVVELLLDNGADVNAARNGSGPVTPLYLAYRKGRSRVADLLKIHGADEVDPRIRKRLDIAAALSRISARDIPSGVNPQRGIRRRFEDLSRNTEKTLAEQGRVSELAMWQDVKSAMLEAIASTPVTEGVSGKEFQRALARKLLGDREGDFE